MMQKVVIIGHGYNNRLAILRSIGELGYEVSIVVIEQDKQRPIDSYSKYVTNCYQCQAETEEALVQVLLTYCIDNKQKVILIPTNDFSVFVIDRNHDKLEQYFLFPNIYGRQGTVIEWMDKAKQKQLAGKLGLKVANSKSLKIANGIYNVPSDVKYPCFVKAQSYVWNPKRVLKPCNNEIDLKDHLNYVSERYKDITILVEDFISIEHECAVVGFSDGKEVVIPGVIEILSITNGIARTGRIVPISDYGNLTEIFKQFVLEMGFVGIFDIDFYLSGGEFYFGELNLRFGGSGAAFLKRGVNLPEMFIRTMLGKSSDGMKKEITSSSTYANELVCLNNWFHNGMTSKGFRQILKEVDIVFVTDKSDPVPEKMFRKLFMKKRILRMKMRLKRGIKRIICGR